MHKDATSGTRATCSVCLSTTRASSPAACSCVPVMHALPGVALTAGQNKQAVASDAESC